MVSNGHIDPSGQGLALAGKWRGEKNLEAFSRGKNKHFHPKFIF